MTQINMKEMQGYSKSNSSKKRILGLLKFYLIPGWRDPEFTKIEYEIGKTKSKRKLFRRLLTPLTILGFFLVLFITFCAMFAPWLTPYTLERVTDYGLSGTPPFSPPSPEHPLGTTAFGYDVLGRLIWGCRTALTFGMIANIITTVGGLIVGIISAYFGGIVDSILMRIADIIMVFPVLLLFILFSEMLGRNLVMMLLIFGILSAPVGARFMRSVVLRVRQELYIEAAITGGSKHFKVMFKHILPNAIAPLFIAFFGGVGAAILALTSIAFLGYGDPNISDWGADINYIRTKFTYYNTAFWPGLFILIAVLGFMLIGDGLRDALDPRLSKKIK